MSAIGGEADLARAMSCCSADPNSYAGGDAGTLFPFAFVEETRQRFDGPIVFSGSIAIGHAILAAAPARCLPPSSALQM
jgi:hypothetical protein